MQMTLDLDSTSSAVFSPCRTWRYLLTRTWAPERGMVNFCALNPSVANELDSDNTVTRMIGFAKRWGYGGLYVTNEFALVSTDRSQLRYVVDPVGAENDGYLRWAAEHAGLVVLACGIDGARFGRHAQVLKVLEGLDLWCLGKTHGGMPKHPLYLAKDVDLERYR